MEDHKDAQRVTMGLCDVSTGRVLQLINPRREYAARVTVVVLCVCLFVCLFVYDYSRTTGYDSLRGGL